MSVNTNQTKELCSRWWEEGSSSIYQLVEESSVFCLPRVLCMPSDKVCAALMHIEQRQCHATASRDSAYTLDLISPLNFFVPVAYNPYFPMRTEHHFKILVQAGVHRL